MICVLLCLNSGLYTYGSNKNSQLGHDETDAPSMVEGLEKARQVPTRGTGGWMMPTTAVFSVVEEP